MTRRRSLLVGICTFALLAGGGTIAGSSALADGGPQTSARGPAIKVPKSLKIGKKVVLRARGFSPKVKVSFVASIDGTATYNFNVLGKVRTNKHGNATLRTRFPGTYKYCDANRKCKKYPWTSGTRIALTASTHDGSEYVRKVRRIK